MKGSAKFLLAFVLLPAAVQGQAGPLRIEAGGRTTEVQPVTTGGEIRFPARALAGMGARLRPGPAGLTAILFDDTLEFTLGSPYFRGRSAVQPLALPVAAGAEGVLLPRQFFAEWLPAAFPGRVQFEGGVLRVSGPVAFPEPEQTEPPKRIVIIDPGHGGRDTGKIGPNGLREKDAVLRLGRRLGELLEQRGYEVHLTRTRDTLIALDDRPRLANRWKGSRPAAIYLSIHMNSVASGARNARGFETFFLSEARTEDEQRVAEMENAAVEFEDGDSVVALSPELLILNGLRNDFYVRASNDLAESIQRGIATVHSGPNRGVKRAGFRVLIGALMPAVLIEVGFISHPAESRQLGDAAFQAKVAAAIADAVAAWFDANEHLWSGLE